MKDESDANRSKKGLPDGMLCDKKNQSKCNNVMDRGRGIIKKGSVYL